MADSRVPGRLAAHSLYGRDTTLTTFAAFDHALQTFNGVKTVGLQSAVTHADRSLDFAADRKRDTISTRTGKGAKRCEKVS